MKMRLIYALILVLIVTSTVFAGDAPPAWPMEERCAVEPTQSPDDWSFEGTIIATGWTGVHGMNGAWDAPRILAFNDRWIAEGGYGTLSPDGRWYAVPQATFRRTSDIYRGNIEVTELLLYDLADRQNFSRIEWSDTYEVFFGSGASRFYTFRTPVWLDEDTVVYQRGETYYLVHVPGMEVEVWPYPSKWQDVSPVWVYVSHASPDWSRIVIRDRLFDTAKNEIIAEVYQSVANIDVPSTAWRPDSTEFVISGSSSTSLFDADGQLLEVISSATEGEVDNYTYVSQNAYSPDGALFWLTLYPDRPARSTNQHLALASHEERTIFDTCIDSSTISAQFSTDGQYIALLSYAPGQQQLQIFDVEKWQLYNTGIYHEGVIIGWRADI